MFGLSSVITCILLTNESEKELFDYSVVDLKIIPMELDLKATGGLLE